jgi:hypothetical protein
LAFEVDGDKHQQRDNNPKHDQNGVHYLIVQAGSVEVKSIVTGWASCVSPYSRHRCH